MKRHQNLVKLSKDHHEGLILAQLIKKNSPPYKGLPVDVVGKREYTINFFGSELKKHFENEEKILLPVVKRIDQELDKLLKRMLDEHKQISSLIDKLKAGDDNENVLDQLGNLLEQHIRMEERELFEKIQIVCSEEILNQIKI
ncbi:MAG: hemerythrin domain-containing protein [Bacteroidota bacterium]